MNTAARISIALTCAFLIAHGRVAHAAVFNIPNGDVVALKNAINAANANGAADTINLASGGTYTLTSVDNSTNGAAGLPAINNDVAGLDLTINGNGAKIQRSAVVGTPVFRILTINDGASVNCVGLTIANGKLNAGSIPASAGGAIYASNATLGLTNCTLRNNAGGSGGAIYKDLGSLTADTSFIIGNSAGTGAGIFSTGGNVVVTNSDLTENVTPAGGLGGAIRSDGGQLTISDSRLNLNTAGNGGAIANLGTANVQRSMLSDNVTTTGGGGGAIYNGNVVTVASSAFHGNRAGTGGAIYNFSVSSFSDSTFSNNDANSGGAFTNAGGSMLMTACTVSRNTADDGGGLRVLSGSVNIRCATFALNAAAKGGGIYNGVLGGASPSVTLRNTILQQGASGANLFKDTGSIVSQGFNLSSDAAGGDANTIPGGFLNEHTDIRNTNANLGPLQNNGGLTLTHAPIASSPAIDAGDDSVLGPPIGLTSDQRGAGFPRIRGTHVDIGALESGVALVVTTIDDHDDGDCTAADCTLREALTAANEAGSGNISFASGVTGTILLGSELPVVGANLVLVGPGPNQLSVRRDSGAGARPSKAGKGTNSGDAFRILTISNGTNNGPSVSLVGLRLSNGLAPSATFPANSGGGILNDHGTLQLTNCIVSASSSSPDDQTYGGGIFNYEGRLFVTGCTIVGNTSFFGGGIASYRTTSGVAGVEILDSTISGNISPGGRGGGVFNQAENANSIAQLKMTNCTVSGNDAGNSFLGSLGGGLFTSGRLNGSATATIADCTFSDNNADAAGGIYNLSFSASALISLRNTLLKTGPRGENFINSSGTVTSLGHNISNDDAGFVGGTQPAGYLNAAGDLRNTDPLLGPLQANGGATFTHALLAGSPAIDAGDDTSDSQFDQRGFARFGTNDVGAFEVTAPVEIVRAGSRKPHGGAGTFDVNFPLSGTPGIECRSGGGSGSFQVVFTFANPLLSVDEAAITSGLGEVHPSSGIGADPHEYIANVMGVADGQPITLTLSNVVDANGSFSPSVSVTAGFLLGDANGDGTVNSADATITQGRSGQGTDATNFRVDVNRDGFINAADATFVRARSGNFIP